MMYDAMISHSGSSSFTHSWSFIFVPRHQSSRYCVLISLNFVWTPLKHLRWIHFLGRLRFIWSCQSRNRRSAGKLVAVGEARQPEKLLAKRVTRILFWCIAAAFPICLSPDEWWHLWRLQNSRVLQQKVPSARTTSDWLISKFCNQL